MESVCTSSSLSLPSLVRTTKERLRGKEGEELCRLQCRSLFKFHDFPGLEIEIINSMPFQVFRLNGLVPCETATLVEQKVKGILVLQSDGLVGYVWSQAIRPRIFTPFLLYKI